MPVNAELDNDINWIDNFIKEKIKSLKSKNILVIGLCFSGTLTRGINKTNFAISNIKEKYLDTPSKIVITSGSLEPVIDGGGGENSVFARSLWMH